MLWFVQYQYTFAGSWVIALTKAKAIEKAVKLVKMDFDERFFNSEEYDITDFFTVMKGSWKEYFSLKWEDRIVPFIEDKILHKYK